MGFRINGGSYPALSRALRVQGRTTLQALVVNAHTAYSPAAGGQFAFSGAPYSAYEGATLSFGVSRNAGASGTVAVDWSMSVSEGSPTPASGTISWNAGEAGVRMVQVTAGVVSADRIGTITLSNPRSLSSGPAPTIAGSTASFTIQNDATQPSQPTLGAPTNVTSNSLIVPLAFGSTDAQSGILDHALEQAAGEGSTAFTQIAQGASIFPRTASGLTPQTTYRYRARGRNRAGLYSIYSPIVEAVTAASSGNDGFVGSYAELNLAAHPLFSIDMAARDYRLFATSAVPFLPDVQGGLAGTGSQQHFTSGWWDNSARCRITPPTTDQYERGIFLGNLHRGGTLAIQEFNLRFEILYGPTIASAYHQQNNGCKHALIQFAPTLGGAFNTTGRPVFFIQPTSFADSPTHRRVNTVGMAPAANTLPGYGDAVYEERSTFDTPPGTNTYYINGPQGFYLVDQADVGTTFLGKPLFKCGQHLTVEYRIISIATAQYPRGLIAFRYTNRAGLTVERGIPFNYQNFFALGQFLDSVQQFGCGQFNTALPVGPGNYFEVGGYITSARNYGGWIGPRSGFILTG